MPRTGRPRGFDKDGAVEKAMLLLWERGFETTSLAELKVAMGIFSPTSFYAAFGSKDALLEAALARYLSTYGRVMAALHDVSLPPREAIERALRETVRIQTDSSHPLGCLVALSAAAPNGGTTVSGLLAKERARNSAAIRACISRAVAAGELRKGADGAGLATMIDVAMAGLSLRARDSVGREELDRGVDAILAGWDAYRL